MTEENKEPVSNPADAPVPETATVAPTAAEARKAPASLRYVLGIKRGMTQIFSTDGRLCGVTEIEAGPCTILRVLTQEKNHYQAVQIGFRSIAEKKLSKPLAGQFKSAGQAPFYYVREIRVADTKGFEPGQILDLEGRFAVNDYVDVQGTSKGKGFAGVMKRHNFHGMPGSHGASDKERSPGSLAARRSLGRVLPGQRMAGHLGHETVSVQKIEVIQVDPTKHRIYLYGGVPGPAGSLVLISGTVKARQKRIFRKQSTVLRDKMGNIIQGKGAKARALAEAKTKAPAAKPAAAKPAEKK